MTSEQKTLSYKLDVFMKYKNKNTEIPQTLVPYSFNGRKFNEPNINQYTEQLKLIIDTISKGIDTNDIVFKNDVKYFVNTINKRNFNNVIKKISNLNLKKKENVQFLACELIITAIRCPIAVKGIYKEKNNRLKSISELVSDVIKHFCINLTKETNNGVGFHDEILKLCRKFFMDFMNILKSIDQNNENTYDNYRGFMSLLGMLFENNLLPHKIVIDCIDSVKRNIFCSKVEDKTYQITNKISLHHEKMFGYEKTFDNDVYDKLVYFDSEFSNNKFVCYRNITECTNYYRGYENFCGHYLNYFEYKLLELEKKMDYEGKMIDKFYKVEDVETLKNYLKENNLEIDENDIKEKFDVIYSKIMENINACSESLTKYMTYINDFLKSHNQIEDLNNQYRVQNRDTMCNPLKQHIIINHLEIKKELDSNLKYINRLCKNYNDWKFYKPI